MPKLTYYKCDNCGALAIIFTDPPDFHICSKGSHDMHHVSTLTREQFIRDIKELHVID